MFGMFSPDYGFNYRRKEKVMNILLEIPAQDERLDRAILEQLKEEGYEMSRSELTKAFKEGRVLYKGSIPKAGLNVSEDMEIAIELLEVQAPSYEAEDIPLDIRYEDEHLLVINKPKGMVVHPAVGHPNHTLVNALLHYCGQDKLSNINGTFRPGIVHRIDKDTSGLLIVAKTNQAHRILAEQLAEHEIVRTYYAIVHGVFIEEKGTIDAPIGRDISNRQRMAVSPKGKIAVTHFEVLENFQKTSFLKLELETGRTHQIRVHLQYLKHPIVGDKLYAPKRLDYGFEGQALHAGRLSFMHPITHKPIVIEAPFPEDFDTLLKQFR